MDRRFLTVLGVSTVLALVISIVFYQISAGPGHSAPKKSDFRELVTAAQAIPVGSAVKAVEVKLVRIPVDVFPRGGISKLEDVIGRPVVSNVLTDEPILEGRLAARGSGMGLAPIIPPGMRGVSVRVNDVLGVSGFVLPGMRVDVLVTGRPLESKGAVTTTVLQNITVLSAGQTMQAESRGQAINTPVVTLLVTPEQAEILTLASTEGHIQLDLRNGSDHGMEKPPGREIAELYGFLKNRRPPVDEEKRARVVAAGPRRPAPPPPIVAVPVPAPALEQVLMIRGNQKTVEVIGLAKAN